RWPASRATRAGSSRGWMRCGRGTGLRGWRPIPRACQRRRCLAATARSGATGAGTVRRASTTARTAKRRLARLPVPSAGAAGRAPRPGASSTTPPPATPSPTPRPSRPKRNKRVSAGRVRFSSRGRRTHRFGGGLTRVVTAPNGPFPRLEYCLMRSLATARRHDSAQIPESDDAPCVGLSAAFLAFVDDPAFPCVAAKAALSRGTIQVHEFGPLGNRANDAPLLGRIEAFGRLLGETEGDRRILHSLVAVFDGPAD